jgi:hypothetical protein
VYVNSFSLKLLSWRPFLLGFIGRQIPPYNGIPKDLKAVSYVQVSFHSGTSVRLQIFVSTYMYLRLKPLIRKSCDACIHYIVLVLSGIFPRPFLSFSFLYSSLSLRVLLLCFVHYPSLIISYKVYILSWIEINCFPLFPSHINSRKFNTVRNYLFTKNNCI